MPPARPRRKTTKKSRNRKNLTARRPWWRLAGVLLVALVLYSVYLNLTLLHTFAGKRWQLPAIVYAQPEELYAGKPLSAQQLQGQLAGLGYREGSAALTRTFSRSGQSFLINLPAFQFWDQRQPEMHLRVAFQGEQIATLQDESAAGSVDIVRLEPAIIGRFFPTSNEDRQLTSLGEVPVELVKALLATEDRDFYQHHGVNPVSIARALLANLSAGRAVQGGSTLTQQLVKNMFLSADRNLWRKLNEAIMAILLDAQFDKDSILEAYLNEIYLGQDGSRAIHGIAAASDYYFGRQVKELELHQSALLVGMIKGPSLYNPQKHTQRAVERRNLVLKLMLDTGAITQGQYQTALSRPADVVPPRSQSRSPFPDYLDLVKTQLRRDYSDSDIATEGLRIFTTLKPGLQLSIESILETKVRQLEARYGVKKNSLQAAVIAIEPQTGEVIALQGSRLARDQGFNRALNAVRQIGSLIKPVTLLTAVRNRDVTLASMVDDKPLAIKQRDGVWQPQNFDKKFRDSVSVYSALVSSYNIPFINLGMQTGIKDVVKTLSDLGVKEDIPAYPSLLLGTLRLSPYDVAQLYQPFAAGGFSTPLQAIRSVISAKGEPLQRYAVKVRRVMSPQQHVIVNAAMQGVTTSGTARYAATQLPSELGVAGKTGTTDELRDSWFVGYSGDLLVVVWLGADDNSSVNLTGSSGALTVWTEIMRHSARLPLILGTPEDLGWQWVNSQNGKRSGSGCESAVRLPFINGSEPRDTDSCGGGLRSWLPGFGNNAEKEGASQPAPQPAPEQNKIDWIDD